MTVVVFWLQHVNDNPVVTAAQRNLAVKSHAFHEPCSRLGFLSILFSLILCLSGFPVFWYSDTSRVAEAVSVPYYVIFGIGVATVAAEGKIAATALKESSSADVASTAATSIIDRKRNWAFAGQ